MENNAKKAVPYIIYFEWNCFADEQRWGLESRGAMHISPCCLQDQEEMFSEMRARSIFSGAWSDEVCLVRQSVRKWLCHQVTPGIFNEMYARSVLLKHICSNLMTWLFPITLCTQRNFRGSFAGKYGTSTHFSGHFSVRSCKQGMEMWTASLYSNHSVVYLQNKSTGNIFCKCWRRLWILSVSVVHICKTNPQEIYSVGNRFLNVFLFGLKFIIYQMLTFLSRRIAKFEDGIEIF